MGVVTRDEVAEDVRGHRVGHPGDRRGVLDRDRNAREWPRVLGADGFRGRERLLGVDVGERVDGRLKRLDAIERRCDQLGRAHLAGTDKGGELARGFEEEVGHRGRRA